MSNYALGRWFQSHKLTLSLLAYHCEFLTSVDQERRGNTTVGTQAKLDSCSVWSVGPSLKVRHQGPARHCLAAAVRPLRDGGQS